MTFGQRLKKARTEKHMTQKQLAEMLSVKHNSISNWENDINKPDPDTIELICGILDITPNYLLANSPDDFSPFEKLLIKRYRNLDNSGKEHIDYELDREMERVTELKKQANRIAELKVRNQESRIPMRLISYYFKNASAKTGQLIINNLPEMDIEIPDIPEYKNVSYAIGVNGNSMEPTYYDGDILLVEATREVPVGEIGIFQIDGECYVKKLGQTELLSLNHNYSNVPLNESAQTMGRVIGKLKKAQSA